MKNVPSGGEGIKHVRSDNGPLGANLESSWFPPETRARFKCVRLSSNFLMDCSLHERVRGRDLWVTPFRSRCDPREVLDCIQF